MGCNESKQSESNAKAEEALDKLDSQIDDMRRKEQDKIRKTKELEAIALSQADPTLGDKAVAPVIEAEPEPVKPPTPPPVKEKSTFKPRVTGDKFEDFEGQFPWFMYDVFEIFEQIIQARSADMGGHDLNCTIDSLIAAFSDTDKDYGRFERLVDELQQKESELCKLLAKHPFYKEGEPEGWINFQYIALWAMLLCTGSEKLKAKIFYHILQDGSGGQEWIAYDDKDFKPGFFLLLDIAVKFPLQQVGDSRKDDDFSEAYDQVAEDFLDEVFDVDAKLDRKEWEARVCKSSKYVFEPSELRKKVLAAE